MGPAARCLRGLAHHPELLVVAFMVAIATALVVPLPPALLDLLLVANLGLSLTLLISALHLRGPLALSTFPTLLLLATLFRLALNVSSTRLILGDGAAGRVITAFGEFVVGGSYVVGAVVFVIVLIVQLLVVAKGAERVAEVGARFTLDALPGKQMAIDADLRSGGCDQEQARMRRLDLEQESQFFGALDGAMKFVKGDAIAGLLITTINIVGGLAVGTAVHGLPASEAAETFTILSIGDGLASQLPALLTAAAAGLVVTRVGSGGRLGADVIEQLAAQPRAVAASGIVLALLGLVPGLPAAPFLALGSLATALGVWKIRAEESGTSELQDPNRESSCGTGLNSPARSKNKAREMEQGSSDDQISASPLVLLLGSCVPASVEEALVQEALPIVRRRLASELGLPLPEIPVARSPRAGTGFELLLHDTPASTGTVPDGPTLESPMDGASFWGSTRHQSEQESSEPNSMESGPSDDMAIGNGRMTLDRAAGVGVLPPHVYVAREVEKTARARAGELLALETVQKLLDLAEQNAPTLVREVNRRLPLPLLWEILVRLLEEQVSIRSLDRILEALVRRGEALEGPASAAALTEQARQALGRQLVHSCAGEDTLAVVLLDPLLEDLLRESKRDTSDGPVLALMPNHQAGLLEAMGRELRGNTILLAPADLRRQLWALSLGSVPEVRVLAYQELPRDAKVQPVARLDIDGLGSRLLDEAA